MLREALNQPLMVIFEDLHWIDAETQALLDLLTESIGSGKVLMLVNYRPEYRHDWGNHASYTQLRLQPLASESAAEMLTEKLGDAAEMQPLRRLIMESTGGNPLFIEETIEELFEEGALVRNGQVKLTRPLSQLRIPPGVKAILASRIDRLPADEKQLIQTLAIIGSEFQLRLVTEVTGQPESAITPMLAELEKREFIFEQLTAEEVRYSFKHALTHDVAGSLMLTERRQALHERTAQAIEALFADRLEAHVNELAYHYEHSANIEQAVKYLTLAGRQANQRSAYLEAIANLNSGLELLKKLPETAERDRHELNLQMEIAPPLMWTKAFTHPAAESAWRRAVELSRRIGGTSQIVAAQMGLGVVVNMSGDMRKSYRVWTDILASAESLNEPKLLAAARDNVGMIEMYRGELRLAHSYLEQVEAAYDHPQDPQSRPKAETALHAISYDAFNLWYLGYSDQALGKIKRTLVLTESAEVGTYFVALGLNHCARVKCIAARSIVPGSWPKRRYQCRRRNPGSLLPAS